MSTFVGIATEGRQFVNSQWFTIIDCYKCGIPFGVPSEFRRMRQEDTNSFWCPNGHEQHYVTSEAARLRKQLEQKEAQLSAEKERTSQAKQQRDESRKSHKRMRNRVKNGVCPCCTRTFQNLLNHMRTEHPEYGVNQALKQLRESYGMTQAVLAKEIGVYSQHVCGFENGKSVPVWARDQIEAWIAEQGDSSKERKAD